MEQPLIVGSFQLMKSLNRSLILNTVREKGPISRADIAKFTKLTPPTISNIVKELLESELIVESVRENSKGGRRATTLIINASNFFIIGLDVGPKYIKGILTDLNARVIKEFKTEISSNVTKDKLLSLMERCIQKLILNGNNFYQNIIGIGVGMHGVVDVQKGVSILAPTLQLQNIPIKEHLEKKFNLIVKVENDARAMTLGEAWFGNSYGSDSSACINIGRGIGGGIIINRKLFHGENFVGGAIGHMTIDFAGPLCNCGNYGCLQALASGPSIAKKAAKQIATGRKSMLSQMVNGELENISGELIYQAAKSGDVLSRDILSESGRYIGIALTNLIHTINPACIVIGGGVSKAENFILDDIKNTINKRALTDSAKHTDVFLTSLGDHATAIGAVSLLLAELFSIQTTE